MNITSLTELKYNRQTKLFNLYYPQLVYFNSGLSTYIVQSGEEMRIDLVMMSIYDDAYTLKDIDVILFLNGIDLPININVGDVILYPVAEKLQSYRFAFDDASRTGENVRKQLAAPNKTFQPDPARKRFVDNGYALPPVVLDQSKPPVRLENGQIVIGGIN